MERLACSGASGPKRKRIDLTAPVRRSVAEVKQQAEELLRWLDPNYAHPAPTLMAFQWAQNASAVTVAARFAHKWEAPGANLAVYSTDKGQGHVNKERTEALVKQLLTVSMVNHTVEAEILAKVQNSRKRFTLSLRLFDETVPDASGWSVVFRKAAGSMQMSRGAEIPELHFQMRKRWAEDWPRLTREDGLEPGAPGKRLESSLTCRESASFYCPSSKSCVAVCSSCQDFPREKLRCTQELSSLQAVRTPMKASFHDEDLSPASVAGLVRWNFSAELLQAEALALCWAPQESKERQGASLVTWSSQLADDQPSLRVPNGTSLRAGQHFSLVVLDGLPTQETDDMCQENVVATAVVQDHWKPQILSAKLHFQDVAPKEMQLMGDVRLQFEAKPAAMPTAVLLRWGGRGPKGPSSWRLLGETSWVDVSDELEMVGETKVIRELLFQVTDAGAPVEVPRGATHFLAFADGPGVVGLEPIATLRFHDIRPPNEMPKSMVAADFSEFADGTMSFSFSFEPGQCEPESFTCDAGSSYALYWTNGAKKLGESIWTSQERVGSAFTTTVTATRPPLARGLMVVAINPQGEMDAGPTAPLPVRTNMEEETDE